MPYVHRMVQAGRTVEHRKMQSFRVHTKGVKRGPNKGTTTERQARINERVAEEHLRWDLNGNFDHRDLHAVLHYYDKDTTFEEILAHKAAFLANLRKACRKRGIKYKAVVVIETKRMTNPHIHVVISRMDPEIITEAWENVPRGGGGISFKPLDRRGNHAKLAAYLMADELATNIYARELYITWAVELRGFMERLAREVDDTLVCGKCGGVFRREWGANCPYCRAKENAEKYVNALREAARE